MRLLNTANFEIQEFRDDRIPRYAILSHTWDEVEITFQDMNGAAVTEKKGYKKVEKCCSMARDRGHDYVWIDTCCIDKTSSAELSEAINSMYRWYQEAEVCYAYLADVLHDPGHRLSGLRGPEFSQSKWFRRGWTLQELIAPLGEVIFLDKEWKEMGTKSTLQDTVSSITGIPVDILTGNKDLESVSVAQRMSWAAERETTKTEDRAYSLMGIFGINMPMIYGEGKRAFIRLQEEIMKVLDDQSIFAWKSEEENHGGLLATSPGAFKESANIISFNPFITSNSPLTISNRGIHLELRFMGIGRNGLGLAILHCAEIGKEDQLIAIYLRDLSLTMELFERVRCQDFEQLNLSNFRQSLYPMRGIYIRQRRLASFRASKEETNLHSNSKLPDRIQTTQMDAAERASSLPTAQEGHNETANVRSARSDVETNFEAENGRTSLSHAAERGHYDEVELLLARSDIQADSRDKYGRTPLSYAAGCGHVEVVWLLLQTGKVDAASNDGEGRTPLLHAVVGGYEEVGRT
ncbi:heterokaryon incompatibility protein-domain-containing protein [Leptodontidium sp. 2 PMI_412]|nr:heterokaryon incompatibility protein-domain-containing protein [Leptodontidium sp. 2 PMI_412]